MSRRTKLSCVLLVVLALGGCSEDAAPIEQGPSPVIPTPDAALPVTAPPGHTAPDAALPGNTTPGNTTPDAAVPGNATPGSTSPEAGVGEASTPTPAPDAGPDAGPATPGVGRGDAPSEASILKPGPYKVMTYTTGFTKAAGVDSSTVHYPTDATPPFAGVAVVPGFVSPESSIQEWGPFLASYGIVTVTIGVPGGDQPDARATKLMGTIEGIKKENSRTGSPLMGKIDETRMAVAGWSMGGGGTLISAANNPTILKAAVSFAAWGPTGGSKNKVPVLMFEATADVLAAGMSDGFYKETPASTPKMLFEVEGSSHNVANSPKNHGNIIGAYGLSWLKVYLEGDERYRPFLLRPFPSITTKKSAHNVK